MKFGIVLPQFGHFASPDAIRRMATTAEELGFDSVWLCDHVVVPAQYTFQFTDTFYELFTTMGYVAACTERVQIGTSVIVLPYRHPVMTAKQISTADRLSGGRIIAGVAFGWNQEEYALLDIPYEKRGRRADECIEVMKECWSSEHPAYSGEFYQASDFLFSPKPLQQPFPPIWIGGNDSAALRRTVRVGDGWHPISGPRIRLTLDQFGAKIEELHSLANDANRDADQITTSLHTMLSFDAMPDIPGDLATLIGPPQQMTDTIGRCRELGVSHMILSCFYGMPSLLMQTEVDGFLDTIRRFATDVLPNVDRS